MGNYANREVQLVHELNELFTKYAKQNSITKKNLMSLNNKFKELKKIDTKKWRNLANRINTISRNANGLNLTTNFIKFESLYKDFQKQL